MAQKEGVKPILFDFDDDEPSTANAGDNINEDSKEKRKLTSSIVDLAI